MSKDIILINVQQKIFAKLVHNNTNTLKKNTYIIIYSSKY